MHVSKAGCCRHLSHVTSLIKDLHSPLQGKLLLGIKPMTSSIVGKKSTTKPHLQSQRQFMTCDKQDIDSHVFLFHP
jgi:hypothetical protein